MAEETETPEVVEDKPTETEAEETEEVEKKEEEKPEVEEDKDEEDVEDLDLADFEEEKEPDDFDDSEDLDDESAAPETATLTLKAIKKEFPDLVKKFPEVKAALFKSREYETYFPSIKDAEAAAQKIDVYEGLERKIIAGDLKDIFEALKKHDSGPAALKRIAREFKDNLADPKLFNAIVEPSFRNALRSMLNSGTSTGNENLVKAAKWAIRFFYKSNNLPEGDDSPAAEDPKISEKEKALNQREHDIALSRFDEFKTSVVNSIERTVQAHISKFIDPEKKMNEFVRKAAVKRTYDALLDKLANNPGHGRSLNNLWRQAFGNARAEGEVGPNIRRVWIRNAKPYLPKLIAKYRAQALGSSNGNSKANGNVSLPGGGSGANRAPNAPVERVNLKGIKMEDIDTNLTTKDDILSGKVTLRKK